MKVILCLSDGGGMMFNKRRQSRDKALIDDIGNLCADGIVFISDFSLPLFEDGVADVIAVSNPLSAAGVGDYAFVENLQLHDFADKIEVLKEYARDLIGYKGEFIAMKELRGQAGWFVKGCRDGAKIRLKLSTINTYQDLIDTLNLIDDK